MSPCSWAVATARQEISGDLERRGHVDAAGPEPLVERDTVDEGRREQEPSAVAGGVEWNGKRARPRPAELGDPALDPRLLVGRDEFALEDPDHHVGRAGIVASEQRPPAERPEDLEAAGQHRSPRR